MTKKPKRPQDPNKLAKMVVDLATMDEKELEEFRKKLKDKKDHSVISKRDN